MGLWEDIKSANNWGNDRASDISSWFGDRGAGAADELDALGRYVASAEKAKPKKKPKKAPARPARTLPPPSIDDDQRAYAHSRMQQAPAPGAGAEQPYDYFAAADKLLTSMGMGKSAGGLADVGSTIASYNQARDAARKNAAVANEQIGIYGQQGQAGITQAGGQSEEQALRNVASVQGTNKQLLAAPDEGVKRAQDIAAAQGVQLSPGILEDAARTNANAKNLAAAGEQAAVAGVTSATQSKNNALQSSSNITAGARQATEGNLNSLLAQLGIEQADKVSSMNADNASRTADYAAQRAGMQLDLAGQIDPLTGRPRTEAESLALSAKVTEVQDPRDRVIADNEAYEKKYAGSKNKVSASGTDAIAVFNQAVASSPDDYGVAAESADALLADMNAERAKHKPPLKPLSKSWMTNRLRRYYAQPTETVTTSK